MEEKKVPVIGITTDDDLGVIYTAAESYLTNNREVMDPAEVEELDAALCGLSAYINGVVDRDGKEIE